MVEPFDADSFNRFEHEYWASSRKAEVYNSFFTNISTRAGRDLLRAAAVEVAERVLDVGCGPGNVTALAAGVGARVLGVDASVEMLETARRAHPEIPFETADAEALAYGDGQFQAVLANFLVLHLGRPERAAAEFHRILAPGGRTAVSVWDEPARNRFLGVFVDAIARSGVATPPGIPAGPDQFRFARDGGSGLVTLLQEAGFENVRVDRLEYKGMFLSADQLWDGFIGSSVRIAALVDPQPPEAVAKIRQEFEWQVSEYRVEDHLEVPVSVLVGSGRRR